MPAMGATATCTVNFTCMLGQPAKSGMTVGSSQVPKRPPEDSAACTSIGVDAVLNSAVDCAVASSSNRHVNGEVGSPAYSATPSRPKIFRRHEPTSDGLLSRMGKRAPRADDTAEPPTTVQAVVSPLHASP